MSDIYLRKHQGYLAAADEKAEEIIAKMKPGQAMKIKYSLPRNYGNHKRFFAFIKVGFDIQDHFTNPEHYRKWLIMKSGYYHIIQAPNGYTIFEADSIAWDSMDEVKFKQVFNRCIDTFIEHWGDRINREQLEAIIEFS